MRVSNVFHARLNLFGRSERRYRSFEPFALMMSVSHAVDFLNRSLERFSYWSSAMQNEWLQ